MPDTTNLRLAEHILTFPMGSETQLQLPRSEGTTVRAYASPQQPRTSTSLLGEDQTTFEEWATAFESNPS